MGLCDGGVCHRAAQVPSEPGHVCPGLSSAVCGMLAIVDSLSSWPQEGCQSNRPPWPTVHIGRAELPGTSPANCADRAHSDVGHVLTPRPISVARAMCYRSWFSARSHVLVLGQDVASARTLWRRLGVGSGSWGAAWACPPRSEGSRVCLASCSAVAVFKVWIIVA